MIDTLKKVIIVTINEAINKVINLALKEVGYKPTYGKRTKYAETLDALGDFYNTPKNGFDYCDVFFDWLFVTCFGADTGRKMLYQPKRSLGAGVGYSANYYKENNAFSKIPERGCQIFFGNDHTGIVVDVNDVYVYTVEANTGGGNGIVARKTYKRTYSAISGYGYPNWKLVANTPDLKPLETITKEVIEGKWGNGYTRKEKLEQAGYNYNDVQKLVNKILHDKDIEKIAKEVIQGKWGNGIIRKNKLKKAGYDYSEVQKKVNEIMGV